MAILRDAFARAYDQATVDPQTTSATCHRHHCTVKSCCSHKVAMGELWLVVFLVLIRPCYIWLLRNCSGNKIVGQKMMKWEPYCSTCWLDMCSFLGIQRPTSHDMFWTSWRVFMELTRLFKTYYGMAMWWYLGGQWWRDLSKCPIPHLVSEICFVFGKFVCNLCVWWFWDQLAAHFSYQTGASAVANWLTLGAPTSHREETFLPNQPE